jgi:hypothetical protein
LAAVRVHGLSGLKGQAEGWVSLRVARRAESGEGGAFDTPQSTR